MFGFFRRRAQKASLTRALSVRHHARYDARLSPAQPQHELSVTERRLDERLDHVMVTLISKRDEALRSERIKAITSELTADERSCQDIVRETKSEIWQRLVNFNEPSRNALDLIHKREIVLEDFKRENLLTRDAYYHDPFLAVGVMALACTLETLLNAGLFAQVSKFGLMGGAAFSIALSLPNLALGFIAGFLGLRYRHHVHPTLRCCGTAVTVLGYATAILWNVYVAHLRAIAEKHAQSARPLGINDWPHVATQILSDPAAAIASPYGILLMGAGLLTFVIAVHDGHHLAADPYPGFTTEDRKLRRAEAAAEALKRELFKQLKAITKNGVRRIDARAAGAEAKCHEAFRILDRARSIIGRFHRKAADQLWVHRAAVGLYQSLNRRLRRDAPPARFDQPVTPNILFEEYDWQAYRQQIRAAALAATATADGAAAELTDHLMTTIEQIEREWLDPAMPTPLPPPPLSHAVAEAA